MRPYLQVGWWGPSHGPWGWVQSQFDRITPLNHLTVTEWLSGSRETDRKSRNILLLGLESRSDTKPRAWLEQRLLAMIPLKEGHDIRSSIGIILGNDWHGHRRTHPLPDAVPTFYWYQWYDRIFPWLSELIDTCPEEQSRGVKRKGGGQRSNSALTGKSVPSDTVPWRVQWTIDRAQWQSSMLGNMHVNDNHPLAWVITDHRDQSDLWQDTCESVGMRVVASRWDRDPPSLQPQLIVIDCVSRPGDSEQIPELNESGQAIASAARQARIQHPDAFLAVVTPFPCWSDWSRWQDLGVDAVLPRPAALQGFLYYWGQWRSRAAA